MGDPNIATRQVSTVSVGKQNLISSLTADGILVHHPVLFGAYFSFLFGVISMFRTKRVSQKKLSLQALENREVVRSEDFAKLFSAYFAGEK